jgi:N utilization substance protein B
MSENLIGSGASRHEVRSIVIHLLYALESFDYQVSVEAIADDFNRGFDQTIALNGEEVQTTQEIVDRKEELNKLLLPLLANWRLDRIGLCTRLILHMALWEMYYTNTPGTVIINEAIELAKDFSEKDAYKFVNGILDQALKRKESDDELVSEEESEILEETLEDESKEDKAKESEKSEDETEEFEDLEYESEDEIDDEIDDEEKEEPK